MPLTFSHPAIVLPLNYLPRRWISLTGLIAGSVAPDFEYFFRMKVMSIYSHTWLGLLWFDIPVGILIAFIYHDVVKAQFVANLPGALNRRFLGYTSFNWDRYVVSNWLVVIISLITGIASHLFWDSFTHSSGYFVQLWNMTRPVQFLSYHLPLYKIIQHTSTLIGGLVILAAIYNMSVEHANAGGKIWPYWFIATGIALGVIGLRMLFGLNISEYWNLLVTTISGGIIGVIIASSLVNTIKQKK